jgi:hypothetical protein
MNGKILYKVRRQNDGSYALLWKYKGSKRVDIHSIHDTFEEAQETKDSLLTKPTQAEIMKDIHKMKLSMNKI